MLAFALTGALVIPALVAAAPAPSPAVKVAVREAKNRFHTGHVHVTFTLRSHRDHYWVLIDGTATNKHRLWAAWLRTDGHSHWKVRYFDTTAPFQPQSTKHGRVPCDLFPAYSEPFCT